MTNTSEISVLLPVYNQADHIEKTVHEYEKVLSTFSYSHETLLVVNGASDASWDVAQSLEAHYASVRAIYSERGGWGLAVRLGIQESKGDIICYTNSARTRAEDLGLLLTYAITNPGTVIKANRMLRTSFVRKVGSLIYNLETRTLFNMPYWDINGTPKVFPREFDKLLDLQSNDDLIDLEFNVVCREENYPLLDVPVWASERHGGVSTTNFASAFRLYYGALKMWRERRGTLKRERYG